MGEDLRRQLAHNAQQIYGGSPITPFVMPAAQALIRTFRRMTLNDSHAEPSSPVALATHTDHVVNNVVDNATPPRSTPDKGPGRTTLSRASDVLELGAVSAPHPTALDTVPVRVAPAHALDVTGSVQTTAARVHEVLVRAASTRAPNGPSHTASTHKEDVPIRDSSAGDITNNPTVEALANILIDITRKEERPARAKAARRRRRAAARTKAPENVEGTTGDNSDGSVPSLETVLDSEDPSSDDVDGAASDEDSFDSD